MRIQVLGDDTISQQARTYAEYRLFAALTQRNGWEGVQDASVVLRRVDGQGAGAWVTCMVTVTMEGAGPTQVRTTGAHPYAAINRAVERIRSARTAAGVGWDMVESG